METQRPQQTARCCRRTLTPQEWISAVADAIRAAKQQERQELRLRHPDATDEEIAHMQRCSTVAQQTFTQTGHLMAEGITEQ